MQQVPHGPYRPLSARGTELTIALWRIMTAPEWAKALKIYTLCPLTVGRSRSTSRLCCRVRRAERVRGLRLGDAAVRGRAPGGGDAAGPCGAGRDVARPGRRRGAGTGRRGERTREDGTGRIQGQRRGTRRGRGRRRANTRSGNSVAGPRSSTMVIANVVGLLIA